MILKTKPEIIKWLNQHDVSHYTIHDDLSVDVNETIDLSHSGLKELPFQFNHIKGDFFANNNELISAKGSPKYVEGSYNIRHNYLTNGKFLPEIITANADLSHNMIVSLENTSLNLVGGNLVLNYNELKNCQDFPSVKMDILLNNNKIKSFKGLPKKFYHLEAKHNQIENFNFFPENLNSADLIGNKFKELNLITEINYLVLDEYLMHHIINYPKSLLKVSFQKNSIITDVFMEDIEKIKSFGLLEKNLSKTKHIKRNKI